MQSGTTDGASIPGWAQPIIGAPFDRSYLKAAILHDHYTYRENHVRSWRSTHRMFRDALLASGIAPLKAQVMYFAVLAGGARWKEIVQGEPCPGDCIKTVSPVGKGQADGWEDDLYKHPAFEHALKAFGDETGGALLSDDAIEREAEKVRDLLMGG